MQAPQALPAAQDPLAELRDIHIPTDVSSWPPAYGWWVLALASLALLILFVRWVRKRRRGVLRFARLELQQLESSFSEHGDRAKLAVQLAELLRRLALLRYPRKEVARLHGKDWVDFLSQHNGGNNHAEFLVLEQAPYARQEDIADRIDPQRALAATKAWIQRNAA